MQRNICQNIIDKYETKSNTKSIDECNKRE